MIEKIYKNNYMVICDNCGTGQECDNWAEVMDFMNEEGWKKKLIDGEFKHYCPECQEMRMDLPNDKCGQVIDWRNEDE